MYGLKVIYCVHFSRQLFLQLFEIRSLILSCLCEVWGYVSSADRPQSVLGCTVVYDEMASTKSLSTFSASLTNLAALLPQSHDCSWYVSRPIPAPPPRWLQKQSDLRAHEFAHTPNSEHKSRLANVTCARRWRICGITPAMNAYQSTWRNIPEDLKLYRILRLEVRGKRYIIHLVLLTHSKWWYFQADSQNCGKRLLASLCLFARPSGCQCAWNSSSSNGWICVKTSY